MKSRAAAASELLNRSMMISPLRSGWLILSSLVLISSLLGCSGNSGATQMKEMPAGTPPSIDPADNPNTVAGREAPPAPPANSPE